MGDWTMKMFKKYLVFNLTSIDRLLISWLPLILAFAYSFAGIKKIQEFIKKVLWTITTVLVFFLAGIAVGLMTWTSDGGDSVLLPEYLKYQPIKYYWSFFIVLGIISPAIPTIISYLKKSNSSSDEIIDN